MSEGLAAYRPATADTRRGRLNILVAQASPYLGPLPGTAGPAEAGSPGAQAGPGAEAGEAEETGAAAPGAWRVAADQPVAAVGGTTGTTHVGGPGELEAARLHRRAAPEAAAEAAAGAAEEGAAGGAPQRPLSPTDARKGQGLAAADVAAGHHAAVDAAAGTAGEAGVSGGAAGRAAAAPEEVQPLLQEEREAEAEARAGPQKPEAAPGEELPGLQQQREAGRAEAGPAVAGTAASAEPGSPASAPSPRPSGLAALQAESALLLEQEAALAPLGEGQEQQQAELEGSAAGPSLAMRKAEEGRPAEQAPSAGAAARVRAQREPGAEPAAEARPSEERAIGMGPALDRLPAAQELAAPLTVGRRRAPSQPLLPAGAFSQAQNVSVFRWGVGWGVGWGGCGASGEGLSSCFVPMECGACPTSRPAPVASSAASSPVVSSRRLGQGRAAGRGRASHTSARLLATSASSCWPLLCLLLNQQTLAAR